MSEGGCTSCGNKGGCDHRKGAMFSSIDAALLRLYPTRSFADRAEPVEIDEIPALGLSNRQPRWPEDGGTLARDLADALKTVVIELPRAPEEYCRQLYVLCLGRAPCLIQALHGLGQPPTDDLQSGPLEELYLRISVSDLVPFAAVQQVRVRGELGPGQDADLLIEEFPRTGVFDPVLLPRMQRAVAVLAAHDLLNLDFGEISAPPPGFDPGPYADRFGGVPAVANYFFYPQPCSSVTTTIVPIGKPVVVI
jgi:hypothetical protein